MANWYNENATNLDVVLQSKINLVRNLQNSPFPPKMDDDMKKSVAKKVFAVIKNSPFASDFEMESLDNMPNDMVTSFVQKDLISQDFAMRDNASFLLNKNESISIMLNDEDHISLNAFATGMELKELYSKVDAIDDALISGLKIAYDQRLGFLTASPFKVGTGLSISYTLHLPALAKAKEIRKYATMVGKLGITLGAKYQDGLGDVFTLTNNIAIGLSENDMISNLDAICVQLVEAERKARLALSADSDNVDLIYRNLGILKLARKISQSELLSSLSLVRLGASLDYFDISYKLIDFLQQNLFDAALLCQNPDLEPSMCDQARAEILRQKLG